MQNIWEFSPWLPYEFSLSKLVAHCRFVNAEEVCRAGMSPGHKRDTPFPVPQLVLTLDDFAIDCFTWESFVLVSERFREALALSEDDVEYFPVDANGSARKPREMNYKVMSVAVTDRVSFPESKPVQGAGGSFLASLIYSPYDIDVDRRPRHHLFHDERFLGSMFCTDALAVGVLRAGCTGIRFFDPRHAEFGRPMRYRTLRGLEEGGWNQSRRATHTRLIEQVAD